MCLQCVAHDLKLRIRFREFFFHLGNLHRSTHACNYILALCIGKEFSKQTFLSGCRITGKRNTGATILTHISEYHRLYIDCGTPGIRNIIIAAVNIRTRIIPGTEYSLDRSHQLFLRIIREITADLGLILCFELICKLFEILGGQVDILLYASLCFHLIDQFLKIFFTDLHNDIGIHLDKTAVTIPRPPRIV